MAWDRLFGSYVFHPRGARRNLGLGYTVPVSRHLIEAIWQPLTPAGHRAGAESRIVSLPEGVTAISDIELADLLAAAPPAYGAERAAGPVHGIHAEP